MKKSGVRIAINGFGRIGRAVFRQCFKRNQVEVVAINNVQLNTDEIAYLSSFDSVYGRGKYTVYRSGSDAIVCDGKRISVFCCIDWKWLEGVDNIDYVVDASGDAEHILAGMDYLLQKQVIVLLTYHLRMEKVSMDVSGHCEASRISNFVSFSTCDVTAVAPILTRLSNYYEIEHAEITILHPF